MATARGALFRGELGVREGQGTAFTIGARSAGRDAMAPQNRTRTGVKLEFFRKQQVLKSGESEDQS